SHLHDGSTLLAIARVAARARQTTSRHGRSESPAAAFLLATPSARGRLSIAAASSQAVDQKLRHAANCAATRRSRDTARATPVTAPAVVRDTIRTTLPARSETR